MIAKATVYLNADKTKAVAEGDPAAKFFLAAAGSEISDATLEKYEGAAEIAGGTKAAPKGEGVETREPKTTHRDPKAKA